MATTAAPLICPLGHGPGFPGTRFCTSCGTQLVAPVAPAQPLPAASAPPSGWMPVPQGSAPPQASTLPPQAWTPGPQVSTPPPQAWTPPQVVNQAPRCSLCGGDGTHLNPEEGICTQCGWLRPLLPGYQLDRSVFLWAGDGKAMATLQSLPALHTVVKSVSDKVGRPWIESTFNAIRLGPRQLPDVWKQAVLAARILGLPKMPDVYISGDQMWNTYTYGTENSSFIVLGTSHLINFANDELLFVLAREMGHCRAGHALWKTVTRFIAGDTSVHSGLLSDGLINAISPTKLIHGALDLPLMAWARQSEITADRAGLLAVGDEALARRVLLAWSVRSARLLQMVNIDEWLKQEDASDDQMTRFSEMTTSSSMYTTRRLRLLGQAAHEPNLMNWSQSIQPVRKKLAPTPTQMAGLGVGTVRAAKAGAGAPQPIPRVAVGAVRPAVASAAQAAAAKPPAAPPTPTDSIRVVCNKCQAAMRVPFTVLRGKSSLNVRCPQCHNVLTLRPKPVAPPPTPAGAETKPVAPPRAPAVAQTKLAAPPPTPPVA
jgi:Zn-dependent protease with chaperone function